MRPRGDQPTSPSRCTRPIGGDRSDERLESVTKGHPRKAAFQTRILWLTAEIARLSEERALPSVRVFSRFLDDKGAIRSELSYDNLHLSGLGYQE